MQRRQLILIFLVKRPYNWPGYLRENINSLLQVPPYSNKDVGQQWILLRLVAWRHQTITWTNVPPNSISKEMHTRYAGKRYHLNSFF